MLGLTVKSSPKVSIMDERGFTKKEVSDLEIGHYQRVDST